MYRMVLCLVFLHCRRLRETNMYFAYCTAKCQCSLPFDPRIRIRGIRPGWVEDENTHRAVGPQSLHTPRVVVLNAAARVSLHVSGFPDQVDHLRVLPNAGRKLGSQVNEVILEEDGGATHKRRWTRRTICGSVTVDDAAMTSDVVKPVDVAVTWQMLHGWYDGIIVN